MAETINTLNINGRLVSWNHTRFTLDGDLFTGYTSITWDESVEVVMGYAATKDHAPNAWSGGKYVPGDLKIKGKVHQINELRAWFAAKSDDGRSYGPNNVQISSAQLQWDMGDGTPEQSVEWETIIWTGNSNTNDENPDPREEEIVLKFLKCKRNGFTLYDSSDEV